MLAHVPPPITPIQLLATFHQGHIPPQTPSVKDTQLPHQDIGDVGSRRHNPGNQKASHAPSAEKHQLTQRAQLPLQEQQTPIPRRPHHEHMLSQQFTTPPSRGAQGSYPRFRPSYPLNAPADLPSFPSCKPCKVPADVTCPTQE
ncbi:uncharacterized protein BDZ83DRAFT_638606 [Colletotrichum acutatum]|uniref:Uncharacterized protein n=1 Tax=Glomerella acutata TaxID=27357 RepID=A0AAD8XD27_GLOAC|nr:uncharacterized protein BDZ83DRAFT_638606 [Colletotrichum acutatum]KAK1712277.1 hypothetical protein BDZ83DRAFT_638606 [Colletotrichum acutatum]